LLKKTGPVHDLINMPENPADRDRSANDRSADDRSADNRSNHDRLGNDGLDNDRRRSARFVCGGFAKISQLPSDGIFVPARIRDLSLHGCCVDTTVPIDCGTRAEIVVRVNAASFRAVGEVRAVRGRSVTGVEFTHLSAGGRDLLADMITDLAKLQAITTKLRDVRREMDGESFRKELEAGKRQAAMLSERFPSFGDILRAEISGEAFMESGGQPRSAGQDRISGESLVITVNLFG
jgi:hypothetical protein